jgi:hypothetical protein
VWELLTVPRLYPSWADSVLVEAPDRPVVAGDRIVLGTGPARTMRVTLEVVALAPPHELTLDVHMPLGIVNHEVVRITPISDGECRVTYN